jgi:hypothetical protein
MTGQRGRKDDFVRFHKRKATEDPVVDVAIDVHLERRNERRGGGRREREKERKHGRPFVAGLAGQDRSDRIMYRALGWPMFGCLRQLDDVEVMIDKPKKARANCGW